MPKDDEAPGAPTPPDEHHQGEHEHHHPPGTAPFLPDSWWGLSLLRRREVAASALLVLVLVIGGGLFLLLGGDDGGSGTQSADAETTPTSATPSGSGAGTTTTTVDAAAYVEAMSADRVATFNSIAQCEASGDWSDDTGNGFYGGLQFTLESWETVGGSGNPAQASQDEQIMRADMLEQLQGWVAWPECAAELGLT